MFKIKKNLFRRNKNFEETIHDQVLLNKKIRKYIYLLSFSTMTYFFIKSIYKTDIDLIYEKNDLNNSVFRNLNDLRIKKYSSTFYYPSRFFEIVYGNKIDSREFLEFTTEEIHIDHLNENLALHHTSIYGSYEEEENIQTPIVLVIPGLSGNTRAEYMKAQINGLRKEGFRVIAFNPIGNGIPQIGDRIFDYRDLEDELDIAVDHIKNRYKGANLYLLGFSLGASYGVKYVASKGKGKIKGMVSISNPFDVKKAQGGLHDFTNKIYGHFLTKRLIKKVLYNKETLLKHVKKDKIDFNLEKMIKSKTLDEFDENFTYKLHPKNPDMFEKLSCLNFITKIDIPIMFINSKNDPLSDYRFVPKDDIKNNGNLFLVATPKGAHVEYFINLSSRRWNVRVAAKYLKLLEDNDFEIDIETH